MKNPADDPVALFLRGVMALGRRMRTERPPGSLSLSGFGILATCNRLGPLLAKQLAEAERLRPQSLTRLLADLEHDELISRHRNEHDRRAVTIQITARGRRMLRDDLTARRAWLEAAMHAVLTPAERASVLAASTIMLKLARSNPEHPA